MQFESGRSEPVGGVDALLGMPYTPHSEFEMSSPLLALGDPAAFLIPDSPLRPMHGETTASRRRDLDGPLLAPGSGWSVVSGGEWTEYTPNGGAAALSQHPPQHQHQPWQPMREWSSETAHPMPPTAAATAQPFREQSFSHFSSSSGFLPRIPSSSATANSSNSHRYSPQDYPSAPPQFRAHQHPYLSHSHSFGPPLLPPRPPSLASFTPSLEQPRQYHPHVNMQSPPASQLYQLPASANAVTHTFHFAKKACIPCRKLKASCDNGRPCGRCVKFGRECVDRSEEEVMAAQMRRKVTTLPSVAPPSKSAKKRPSPSSNASAQSLQSVRLPAIDPALDPTSYANSAEATNQASIVLFSRSFLSVLVQLQLRDTILGLHAVIDSLPLDLPNLLEWHTQCTMLCLQLSNQLSPEDWTTFLTDGLTEQQLNSPVWLNSPLAPWVKLSTRPLFFVIQPLPAHLDHTKEWDHSSYGSSKATDVAELRMEWLPAAHTAYQRWQRMAVNRIVFERQLRANRGVHPTSNGSLATQGYSSPISSTATEHDEAYARCGDEGQDDAVDDLTAAFNILEFSPALTIDPAPEVERTAVDATQHATWCAMFVPEPERDAVVDPSASKMKRTFGMASVGEQPQAAAATSGRGNRILDPACSCALSSPISAAIQVNAACERLFGWRRVEVEAGVRKEGLMWLMRRWFPPSAWPAQQMDQAAHWKANIKYVGEMSIAACRSAMSMSAGCTVSSVALSVTPPALWVPKRECIRTKLGLLSERVFRRYMRIQLSNGASEPSAIIVTWVPTTAGKNKPSAAELAAAARTQQF